MSISFSNVPASSGAVNKKLVDFDDLANLDFELNCDSKTTSRQVGNVRTEVNEFYSNGRLQDKSVNTYYVDKFTKQKDPNRPTKTTTYYYDNSGVLTKTEMTKESTKFSNAYEFSKTKIGNNGKWYNAYLNTPDIRVLGDADGKIKSAKFGVDLYGLQTKIKDMPKHAQKMFYSALDFLMENIKKIR